MLRTVQNSTNLLKQSYKTSISISRFKSAIKFEDFVQIKVKGETLKFPNVWLRDNCQCPKCFHYSAKSRILDWSTFDVNVLPSKISQSEETVKIAWSDGHSSFFNINWLKFRSFDDAGQKNYRETIYKPSKITWSGDEFQKICSKHNYNDILVSNEALYEWLNKVSIYGVAVIENTPNQETALDKLVAKIGFPKQTHYGVKFIVQHVEDTSNVAYLSSDLPLHVDLPYYEYCPGVNMLHCLVQTSSNGGENLLSDAHFTAKYIEKHHPEAYKLLTDVEVEWSDIGTEHGKEFFKLHREPVICLNKHKEITRINFSIPQRGSILDCHIDQVKPWYEAHSLFFELNKKFAAKFKTKAGDILVFDNIRLLHGRNRYEDKSNNVRKLIGAYVDWDEVYSKLRCLKVKLHKDVPYY